MQQQEPHELMPVRQSPVKQPRMGRRGSWIHRDPPLRQDPKTRDRTGSTNADGPVWHQELGEWLLPRVGGTGEESLARHLWVGALLCKHSIISCTSKSRAKLSRKFYFHKNWPPLQGTTPESQRKSHLPRQWLWWFHTKLVTKAGKCHQSASEIHVRSFTRRIQHSVHSVVTQGTSRE